MRTHSIPSLLLAFLAAAIFVSTGCENETKPAGDGKHDDHSHEHDHDDSHHAPHGPNNGHIFELDSPDYSGEWCKNPDDNVIRMYVLDADGKNTAVKVDSFIVTPQVGNDVQNFELKPIDPDENGAAAGYQLDDRSLYQAIPLGVDIKITIGDKTLKGEIKAHEPLDH